MFKICYEILEEERFRISQLSRTEVLEKDTNTIVGQIQLSFQKNIIGFVDKKVPYEGEFLITWLRLLNESIIFLDKYGYATMYEPDTDDIWLEFSCDRNQIHIKRVKVENENVVTSFIESTPKRSVEVFWDTDVMKNIFFDSVLEVTHTFIQDVLSMNGLIAELSDFKTLEDCYSKARQVFNKSRYRNI